MNQDADAAELQRVASQIEAAMEMVPFARWLGLRLTDIEGDRVSIGFDMRPEFVGNPHKQALHGGIISSVLDTVGGFAAILGLMTRVLEGGDEALASSWVGTIDMRTDFLRPAIGDHFTAFAFPLRVGRRLVVTRMELHRAEGELIAVGTGTYVVP